MLTSINNSFGYDITKRYINQEGKSIIKRIATGEEVCITSGQPIGMAELGPNLHLLPMVKNEPVGDIVLPDYYLLLTSENAITFSKNLMCRIFPRKNYVRIDDQGRTYIFKY